MGVVYAWMRWPTKADQWILAKCYHFNLKMNKKYLNDYIDQLASRVGIPSVYLTLGRLVLYSNVKNRFSII